jgi:hypothetical protein
MDNSIWSIVIAFIIDGVILSILVLLFFVFRRLRAKSWEGAGAPDPNPPQVQEVGVSLCAALKQVWSTSEEDMLKHCHVEGMMYYKVHKNLTCVFCVMSVFSMAVLVSVYTQGDTDYKEDIEAAGYAHVAKNEKHIIASFLCLVLFTTLSSVVLYRFFAINRRYLLKEKVPENVLTIDGIPGAISPAVCEKSLLQSLTVLSNTPMQVVVPQNLADAYWKFKDVKPIRSRRQELEEYYLGPDAPKKITGCCKKKDELEVCKQKEDELMKKVQAAAHVDAKVINSGTAFVVTGSKVEALALYDQLRAGKILDPELQSRKWHVSFASGGDNVLWECLAPSGCTLTFKRVLLNVIFFLVAFIFMTPTGFLQYIKLIFGSFASGSAVGFIEQFLPTICMFIYMDILLPFFIEKLVKFEQHRTHSEARISAMRKYTFFFVVYLYLVPLIGFQIVELIDVLNSGDTGSLLTKMESRFTKTGLFFFIYMIHMTFLKNGGLLLSAGIFVSRKLGERKALLPATKARAYWTAEFNIPRDMAMTLVCVLMSLSFSIIMPIIVPMCALFLLGKTAVQKYNLLTINYINPTTRGQLVFGAIISFLVCILALQWLTCFVLIITNFASWIALGSIVAVSTILQIIIFFVIEYMEKRRKLRFVDSGEEKEQMVLSQAQDFINPLTGELATTQV